MQTIEFKTRLSENNKIIIPDYIAKRIKKGLLVKVIIYEEGIEEINGRIVNLGKTYEERKKFWEEYEFDGIWNGE